ncbi:glycine--tRNA ligase subunit beta [Sphingorhabdus sp.]|uniref:glycine--tRNA ligase subunit beta n=1 Tax=Sphingorhabdus sp. TaxID=1902408 RepID=UPI0035940CEB
MTDFLLELLSEEIPARMQVKAKEDLARLFNDALAKAGLKAESVEAFATPRRLALIAKGLPLATEAVSEETKGPKVGAPPQAMEGFLRKTGLTQDQLVERDGIYFAVVEKPGRKTADVLGEAIPAIIRAFPWPKSQRWGAASASTESLRWVRPLQGIVALLGDEVVPCEIDGIVSGAATMGHRFHHKGPITIGNAGDYIEKLRACHVIVHFSERCAIIRDGAKAAAEAAGLTLVEDEGLVTENAGLTEWPVPMLGRFDPSFLEVPQEVIQLTARVNQKYFVCHDANGKLANAFVCTANIVANDGGAAIVAGNEKVLAARLSDAKFFWEQDLKVALDDQAKKLSKIVFHEKLGTLLDRCARMGELAGTIEYDRAPLANEDGYSNDPDRLSHAAKLSKADLVTSLVGEFPELQGVVGRYIAQAQNLPKQLAVAIEQHYQPLGANDVVPVQSTSVYLALAEKIDTLIGFFGINEKPTGSKDPFALRRAALGVLRIVIEHQIRVPLLQIFSNARDIYAEHGVELPNENVSPELLTFFADRLKVQQREAGVRHDLIDAVFALGGEDDLVRLLARVKALQAFVATDEGVNLLAGYKRAANILKQSSPDRGGGGAADGGGSPLATSPDAEAPLQYPSGGPPPHAGEELALLAALDTAELKAATAIDAEDFEGAMAALASLRAPIDAFFEGVMVNDPDPAVRAFRLGLLARFRDAVHRVADFSKIEG